MSHEICHSHDLWDNLRRTIRDMLSADYETGHEWLVEALAASYSNVNNFLFYPESDDAIHANMLFEAEKKRLAKFTGDVLEDLVIEQIQKTNTTDNGGFNFYIDRAGWYTLAPKEQE